MEGMVQRYNGDLANDWGNLVSRLLNMTEKYADGLVPKPPGAGEATDDHLEQHGHAEVLQVDCEARRGVLARARSVSSLLAASVLSRSGSSAQPGLGFCSRSCHLLTLSMVWLATRSA